MAAGGCLASGRLSATPDNLYTVNKSIRKITGCTFVQCCGGRWRGTEDTLRSYIGGSLYAVSEAHQHTQDPNFCTAKVIERKYLHFLEYS